MRIAVFCGSDGHGKIYFLGYGNIVGKEVPGAGAMGYLSYLAKLHGEIVPKIILDSGEVVWGTEIRWMEHDASINYIKKMRKANKIIDTSLEHVKNISREKGLHD